MNSSDWSQILTVFYWEIGTFLLNRGDFIDWKVFGLRQEAKLRSFDHLRGEILKISLLPLWQRSSELRIINNGRFWQHFRELGQNLWGISDCCGPSWCCNVVFYSLRLSIIFIDLFFNNRPSLIIETYDPSWSVRSGNHAGGFIPDTTLFVLEKVIRSFAMTFSVRHGLSEVADTCLLRNGFDICLDVGIGKIRTVSDDLVRHFLQCVRYDLVLLQIGMPWRFWRDHTLRLAFLYHGINPLLICWSSFWFIERSE